MGELPVQLNGPFGPLKPRPVKDRGTQFDDRGVQQTQRMLKAKPAPFGRRHTLAPGQQIVEHRFKHLPWSVGIGIGQGRAGRRLPQAQMHQLPEAGRQPAADLPEGVRRAHLAKQHRDELVPAGEPFGRMLRPMLPHGARKGMPINQGQKLRKTTGDSYHGITSGL